MNRMEAQEVAWRMSYEEQRELLEKHGWKNFVHWDNWERPGDKWTFDTHGAVVNVLMTSDSKNNE